MRRNDATSAMLRNGTFRPATANSPLRFSKRKLVVPLDSTNENENLNTTNTHTDTPKYHRTPSDKSMDGLVGNELLEFRKRHMASPAASASSSPLKSRNAKEQKQLTPTPSSKRREKKELQVDRFAAVRSKNSRNGGGASRSTGRSSTRPSATSSSTHGSADRGGGRNQARPSSTQRSDPFAHIAKESPRHSHRSTNHTLRTTTPQRRKDPTTNPTHPNASSSHTKSKVKSSTTPSSNTKITSTTTAQIEFESLLRIRPFTTTETQSNDRNVLTTPASSSASSTTLTHPNTILLHPLTKPTASRQKELYEDAVTKFHFDSIVGSDVQEKELYEEHVGGLDIAWDVMSPLMETNHESDGLKDGFVGKGSVKSHKKKVGGGSKSVIKNHVILSMGVSNSGKTYSLFGSRYNRTSTRHRSESTSARSQEVTGVKEENQEGIVLRLVEDLFVADNGRSMDQLLAQSHSSSWDSEEDCPKQGSGTRRESNTTSFGVELSMVHVHNEHIFDMLSPFADTNKNETSGNRSSMGRKQSNVMKMAASFESIKKNYKASLGSIQQQQQQHHGNNAKEETLPPMQELKISQDRRTSDFLIHPTIVTCSNPKEVMGYMDKGMEYSTTSSTKMNENSSRGHTMITLQPILTMQPGSSSHTSESATRLGGSITIIDMAGIERTKTSAVRGKSMRESISINGSSTAVLQCLRAIKNNQSKAAKNAGMNNSEDENVDSATLEANASSYSSQKAQLVPYRQSKLTMLMQPLFSGSLGGSKGRKEGYNALTSVKTNVLLLVSVYPGIRDYNEKKSLLQEIDSLRGLTVTKSIAHQQRRRRRSSATNIDPTKDIPSSESIVRDLRQQKMIKSDPATVEEETRSHRHDKYEMFSSPSPLVPSPSQPIPTSTVSSPIDSPELEPLHRQRAGSINDDHSHAISTIRSPLRQQSPLKRLSNMVNPLSCKKRKAKEEEDVLTKRIRVLEKKHESLMEKHSAMKTKCTILQEENMNLMTLLEESKERERELSIQLKQQQEENEQNDKKRGTKRKSNDDTFFQAVRDVRRKEQTLLPSPLRRHMEEVEQNELLVYGGISGPTTGRCFKEPFPLVVPCTQQPRPSLQQPFQATALQFLSQLDGRASSQDSDHVKGSSDDANHKQGFDGMALQFLSNLDKPREKNDKLRKSDASA